MVKSIIFGFILGLVAVVSFGVVKKFFPSL